MVKIAVEHKKVLSRQDYKQKRAIDGVLLVEIKSFNSDDGSFSEIIRLSRGKVVQPEVLAGFAVAQINHSLVLPGTKKAWHLHQKQDEIWFVHPSSRVIVGLMDVREKSPTKGEVMRLVLGAGKSSLVYIPRGVAHGLSNPYQKEASMSYLVNNHFDGTDELRLPYDYKVGERFWEITRG